MNNISLFKLFLIFTKIGAILLGGGYVILPIIKNEFCEKRDLIKYEEILEYFALSQSLPGIIAANMSMFIGYKLKGKLGLIVAMIGITFVPFWTIVLLASILQNLINNNFVQGALWGVGIAVITLILLTIREAWQSCKKNSYFYLIFVFALIMLSILHFSPIKTILITLILGIFLKKFILKEDKQ